MAVDAVHPEYQEKIKLWEELRDVLDGERTIKKKGEQYVPKLSKQTDEAYRAYVNRGEFFAATARTREGLTGMVFRKDPQVKLGGLALYDAQSKPTGTVQDAMQRFARDCDMRGSSLYSHIKWLMNEVIGMGRAGTMIEFQDKEKAAFLVSYPPEAITNWRVERLGGKMVLTMVTLKEVVSKPSQDRFAPEEVLQYRELALENDALIVRIWQLNAEKKEWVVTSTVNPQRMGNPVPFVPFVFHSSEATGPCPAKPPLADMSAVNLDHFRITVDWFHGLHFTALPTAWVAGFPPETNLEIGSTTAWVSGDVNAKAGFLEFMGKGLGEFPTALDRLEAHMAVLGARMLEAQKKAVETAQAMEIRQNGEGSALGNAVTSLSESLSRALKMVVWWHSTEKTVSDMKDEETNATINTEFMATAMDAPMVLALVKAWQSMAISRPTLASNFRRAGIIPSNVTDEEEEKLIQAGQETIMRAVAAAAPPPKEKPAPAK